mgnify:CR=1 FL=1
MFSQISLNTKLYSFNQNFIVLSLGDPGFTPGSRFNNPKLN